MGVFNVEVVGMPSMNAAQLRPSVPGVYSELSEYRRVYVLSKTYIPWLAPGLNPVREWRRTSVPNRTVWSLRTCVTFMVNCRFSVSYPCAAFLPNCWYEPVPKFTIGSAHDPPRLLPVRAASDAAHFSSR